MDGFVNVAVRIRPFLNTDLSINSVVKLISTKMLEVDERFQYNVDRIFEEDCTQTEIYNEIVKPLIEKVRSGYNSTIFAYGQTGTGKTYTMGSNLEAYEQEDSGFIMRSISDFLQNMGENTVISISFFEIYNEKVYDLLSPKEQLVSIKNTQDLHKEELLNLKQAKNILKKGISNRHVSKTLQNNKSSRSHAIITIHFSNIIENESVSAKLNLVDLAGSESVKKTGNQGHQFQEGVNINKGLLSIGRVVNALTTHMSYIPYRESKITTTLQDSLNKNNHITLIACISPNREDIRETIQTLDFAQETKKIKNRPESTYFSTRKKINQFQCAKRPRPQNIFNPIRSSKKPKFNDVACSPIKSLRNTFLPPELDESVLIARISSEFSTKEDFDISPIVKNVVEKELSKLSEKGFTENSELNIDTERLRNRNETIVECTPLNQLSVKRLETIIAQTVRNEISKFTFHKPLVTSSPYQYQLPKRNIFNEANNQRRRSERIALKELNSTVSNTLAVVANDTFKMPNIPVKTKKIKPKNKIAKKSSERRISKLIQNDDTFTNRESDCKASPKSSHQKYVFDLLNSGNELELQKLATVGPKTAYKICLYRKLNGEFKDISHFKSSTIFSGKKGISRFCKENFIDYDF